MNVIEVQHSVGMLSVAVPSFICVSYFLMILFELLLEDLCAAGINEEYLMAMLASVVHARYYDSRYAPIDSDD